MFIIIYLNADVTAPLLKDVFLSPDPYSHCRLAAASAARPPGNETANAQHLLRLYQTDERMECMVMKGDARGLCLRKPQRLRSNDTTGTSRAPRLAPGRNRVNENMAIRGSAGL